jgi:glycosyltransferase involved in cell wall biosynthesis
MSSVIMQLSKLKAGNEDIRSEGIFVPDQPLLSVIIPAYNRADFLRDALESVINQTYFEKSPSQAWELIVVDDGSTDSTQEVIRAFGDRIRYLYLPHSGVSTARNLGLSRAAGEFIAYLDSDDLWKPDKIETQIKYMLSHSAAVVCCTEEIWIRNSKFVNPRKKHRKFSGMIFDKVLPLCLLSLSSALFRRCLFQEVGWFDESLPACEDYDLGIRIAARYPMTFLGQPLIVKRGGHPDQLSKQYWGMDRFRVQALEKALFSGLNGEQKRLVKNQLRKKYRILINGAVKRGKYRRANAYRRRMQHFAD